MNYEEAATYLFSLQETVDSSSDEHPILCDARSEAIEQSDMSGHEFGKKCEYVLLSGASTTR